MNKKELLIIGAYNEKYDRNKIIFECLGEKFSVTNINIKNKNKFLEHLNFFQKLISYGRKNDYIFFVFPSYNFVFLALIFKLFFNRTLIYDAFISVYDTHVLSNKIIKKNSLKAYFYFILDYLFCHLAQILIFDTEEHKHFFEKKFKIENKQKIILPVAVNIKLIDKINPKDDNNIFRKENFNVFFYGKYTALHGVEYIVKAANILKENQNIKFILVGSGIFRSSVEKLSRNLGLKNIIFLDKVNYKVLISYIKASDICLGIFGNTDKARRVIPNKVLDYLACDKITITRKSEAMAKHFKDNRDLFYVDMANEKNLAEKILYLYNNFVNLEKNINTKEIIRRDFSRNKIRKIIEKEF